MKYWFFTSAFFVGLCAWAAPAHLAEKSPFLPDSSPVKAAEEEAALPILNGCMGSSDAGGLKVYFSKTDFARSPSGFMGTGATFVGVDGKQYRIEKIELKQSGTLASYCDVSLKETASGKGVHQNTSYQDRTEKAEQRTIQELQKDLQLSGIMHESSTHFINIHDGRYHVSGWVPVGHSFYGMVDLKSYDPLQEEATLRQGKEEFKLKMAVSKIRSGAAEVDGKEQFAALSSKQKKWLATLARVMGFKVAFPEEEYWAALLSVKGIKDWLDQPLPPKNGLDVETMMILGAWESGEVDPMLLRYSPSKDLINTEFFAGDSTSDAPLGFKSEWPPELRQMQKISDLAKQNFQLVELTDDIGNFKSGKISKKSRLDEILDHDHELDEKTGIWVWKLDSKVATADEQKAFDKYFDQAKVEFNALLKDSANQTSYEERIQKYKRLPNPSLQ